MAARPVRAAMGPCVRSHRFFSDVIERNSCQGISARSPRAKPAERKGLVERLGRKRSARGNLKSFVPRPWAGAAWNSLALTERHLLSFELASVSPESRA